jgi:acetyl/propionyl-CoA carboxylase alpha subunit
MQRAGVPVVPGNLEPLPSLEEAAAYAAETGFPIALKAVAGGGGKGMRVVHSPEEMPAAFRGATGEAQAAFGDAAVYVEKYVERPRHVEIQFLADRHGNAVSLGERECSIQRRHQKLVEESPSPAVDAALRARMGEAAVRAARAVRYVGAGTAEFLLAPDGAFYFLEVNARLQVEHPVTELVTGLDLVAEQVRVAAGEPLGYRQQDVVARGWAIECRISAEDPANRFYPSTGRVLALRAPAGPGVRLDSGIEAGMEVGVHYDPLLAKLITWGADREQARRRMRRALDEYLILGLKTTIPFHRWLLDHPAFRAGQMDTGFLEREWRPDAADDPALAERAALLAALVAHTRPTLATAAPPTDGVAPSRWRTAARLGGLRGA